MYPATSSGPSLTHDLAYSGRLLSGRVNALYVSPHLSAKRFGGSMFAAMNLELLREAFAGTVTAASVSRTPARAALAVPTTRNKLETALANLRGLCGTLSVQGVACLRELLIRERPALVWLDTSILGTLIPLIRSLLPETRIVCAFQNVEADVLRQRVAAMQVYYLPALWATRHNEEQSARDADLTLALHPSDASRIESLYGRRVDRILPIIVPDTNCQPHDRGPDSGGAPPYALFVGSAFPPNIEALEFMCRQVAPRLRGMRLLAVGSGLEAFASRFNHPKLEIKGFVEDLSSVYNDAAAVVAPIFSGGGMKVKIAEALMHGKTVIASPFAALGFEGCNNGSVRLAHTAEEYALQLARIGNRWFNHGARADYEKHFSHSAGLRRVSGIVAALRCKTPALS